jgi:Arc/MetJ-type ribon-helix-helix transcriptional regulator
MSTDLSPQYEQFIEEAVKNGLFRDRRHALEEAVRLLRRRAELLEHIDEGTRQLRTGQFQEVDEAGLRALFDDIQTRGQARYTASKDNS